LLGAPPPPSVILLSPLAIDNDFAYDKENGNLINIFKPRRTQKFVFLHKFLVIVSTSAKIICVLGVNNGFYSDYGKKSLSEWKKFKKTINTPPELKESAKSTTANLVPESSKRQYETSYEKFADWCKINNVPTNSFSENVILAYLGYLGERYAPSTL